MKQTSTLLVTIFLVSAGTALAQRDAGSKIRGTAYQLRTDLPLAELQALVDHVDDTMKELDPKSSLPPNKLTVLASLSITGELFEQRRRHDDMRRTLGTRVDRLSRMLEEDARYGATHSALLASRAGALLYPHLGYEQHGLLLLFFSPRGKRVGGADRSAPGSAPTG